MYYNRQYHQQLSRWLSDISLMQLYIHYRKNQEILPRLDCILLALVKSVKLLPCAIVKIADISKLKWIFALSVEVK